MAKNDKYVADLMLKIIGRQTGEISNVDFKPQKPAFPREIPEGETKLERRTPESQGISSADIVDLLNELSHTPKCRMHKIMVIRNGYVIGECAYRPYDMDMWHVTHSMCKSITGMAIGLLISEGKLKLTDKIQDIFSNKKGLFTFFKQADITVENLLTMTSGIDYNEAGAIAGNDWRKRFMNSNTKAVPGTVFDYNSMNSYMLSAIITEITGETLVEYLTPRIFEPLGIKRIFWESCPQNITKGGWGLFMRMEDMAKVGQLYIQKGMWEGKQIIPKEWVEESVKPRYATQKAGTPYYGYQLWLSDARNGAFTFNGMLGQNVFCFPDINMIICTNAANSDIFQAGCMSDVITRFMHNLKISNEPLVTDIDNQNLIQLKAACKHYSGRTASFPAITSGGWSKGKVSFAKGSARRQMALINRPQRNTSDIYFADKSRAVSRAKKLVLDALSGKKFDLDTPTVGIFPLLMQVFHNNFTDGIWTIGFEQSANGLFYMNLYEGDSVFHLLCNFEGRKEVNQIEVHGEKYDVSVTSVCKTDEYDRLVLRNEINFLEASAVRIINIYFDPVPNPDSIEIHFNENPGNDLIVSCLGMITGDSEGFSIGGFVMNKLTEYGAMGAVSQTISDTVTPVVRGYIHVDYNDLLTQKSETEELLVEKTKLNPDDETQVGEV
ncbi:MAG: beta-lactamase family protein [Butyrivibrio sp.]|nr:beta-lactamase family protein [Butyrivibrio sp.]